MRLTLLALCLVLHCTGESPLFAAAEIRYASHPPTRPLPKAVERPLAPGPTYYVDAKSGDDAHAGSRQKPWRTIRHAVRQLKAGDTLCLNGGTYYEHVTVSVSGTLDQPITIRAAPGAQAILDGGLREFFETPAEAWEPCPDGAPGEYRSTKTYADLGGVENGTNVLGNFGDSLVPLHGYRLRTDLTCASSYWNLAIKTGDDGAVYCGPGLWFSPATGRIHARLAHTDIRALGDDNYRGETDPRKLPLVVAGHAGGSTLALVGAQHVVVQDLVLRGAREATLALRDCVDIRLEGLTVYGGASPVAVRDTAGLRMVNTACRGLSAPWTFRGALKYRAIESRLFSAGEWNPMPRDNRDFELCWCEFTDSVDGVFVGNVQGVRFHHNVVDNISDDGLFLTAATAFDGSTPGGDVQIHHNLLARCLTTFAFGVGHGRQRWTDSGRQTGAGVYVHHNVFDFRRPVMYLWPSGPEEQLTSIGRIANDHGSPAWEPLWFYHNTVVTTKPMANTYYAAELASHVGTGFKRRVFNNIFVQTEGIPAQQFPEIVLSMPASGKPASKEKRSPADDLLEGDDLLDKVQKTGDAAAKRTPVDARVAPEISQGAAARRAAAKPPTDFQADGNLHWSVSDGAGVNNYLAAFRDSAEFVSSRKLYAPGWTAHDRFADPRFQSFAADWRQPLDVRLQAGSPAIDAGVALPADWPASSGIQAEENPDADVPDIGAVPLGAPLTAVGVQGRYTLSGAPRAPGKMPQIEWSFPADHARPARKELKPALLVQGYPAFDAPLLAFALERHGIAVERIERTWPDSREFSKYCVIAVEGSLARAGIQQTRFSAEDLGRLQQFLEDGGTLLLMRERTDLFATGEGRKFMTGILGTGQPEGKVPLSIRLPEHRWLRHLAEGPAAEWLAAASIAPAPLKAGRGEILIGTAAGSAILYRVRIGKGQLIYVGWNVAASLPHGRTIAPAAAETQYEQQMQILLHIAEELAGTD